MCRQLYLILLSSLILLVLSGAVASQTIPTAGYLYWGHCDFNDPRDGDMGLGFMPEDLGDRTLGVWSRFSRSQLREKSGCSVVGIRIAMQHPLRAAVVALKDRVPGESLRSKVTDLQFGWNEIFFDTPLSIEDLNGLYFGYSYNNDNLVSVSDIDVISTDMNKEAGTDAFMYNFDDESVSSATDQYGALRAQLIVSGPEEEINNYCTMSGLHLDGVLAEDKTLGASYDVTNTGANDIEDLEIIYLVDNAQVKTDQLSASIQTGQTQTFRVEGLPVWNGQALRIQIRKINGYRRIPSPAIEIDVDGVLERGFKRTVLLEQFSTENCSSCPAAHKNLHTLMDEGYNKDIIWIIHHDGYTADPFTLPESKALYALYGPEGDRSIFAPAISLDRMGSKTGLSEGKYKYPAHSITAGSEDNSILLDEAIARPATATVQVSEEMDLSSRILRVSVTGEILPEVINKDQVFLNLFIVEDNIWAIDQKGNRGEPFLHYGLVRQFVTGAYGEQMTIDETNHYSYSTELSIPQEWSGANIRIVAALSKKLHEYDDSDIYNSGETKIKAFASVFTLPTDSYAIEVIDGSISAGETALVGHIYKLSGIRCANEQLTSGGYIAEIITPKGSTFVKVWVP